MVGSNYTKKRLWRQLVRASKTLVLIIMDSNENIDLLNMFVPFKLLPLLLFGYLISFSFHSLFSVTQQLKNSAQYHHDHAALIKIELINFFHQTAIKKIDPTYYLKHQFWPILNIMDVICIPLICISSHFHQFDV